MGECLVLPAPVEFVKKEKGMWRSGRLCLPGAPWQCALLEPNLSYENQAHQTMKRPASSESIR